MTGMPESRARKKKETCLRNCTNSATISLDKKYVMSHG